jgi:hypothetical protein
VTPRKAPTAEDHVRAAQLALESLAAGASPGELKIKLEPLHPPHDTFPGEVLLELAADAIDEAGASRAEPIEFEGIRDRYLPECTAHTKEQHYKSAFAIRAAAMTRAGVDPGLLDEAGRWRADDLWMWSVDALVVYIRVAADRTSTSVADVCQRLAARQGIDITG